MATKKALKAAEATSGLFTGAETEKKKTVKKAATRKTELETTPKAEIEKTKTAPKEETKREKAVFSVKIDSEVLKEWRYYASMDGYGDKGKLTEAALKEYMQNHALTSEQKKKLKTLMGL